MMVFLYLLSGIVKIIHVLETKFQFLLCSFFSVSHFSNPLKLQPLFLRCPEFLALNCHRLMPPDEASDCRALKMCCIKGGIWAFSWPIWQNFSGPFYLAAHLAREKGCFSPELSWGLTFSDCLELLYDTPLAGCLLYLEKLFDI